jgi:hypothetical protein
MRLPHACPLTLVAIFGSTSAQAALPSPAADPAISALLAQISPARLQATDTKLIAFGTRNTFSEASPPGRGVFAARDWIAAQFRQIAAATGGRMTVALDEYTQPPDNKRIPRAVKISSVIATLHGDEPGGRTYVMCSHFDSRNTDNSDGTNDAPGADDNGSGTSAVLEAARVMAGLHPHATILFATYDAEEQGLLGSNHHAQALKAAGVDVQGALNNDIVGASVGDRGQHNPNLVRIFSEALPAGADPARVDVIGSENDSPARELARYASAIAATYLPGFDGKMINRADRFLRGGDHESFSKAGYAAIRFVEPVETFAHQHQNLRTEGGIQYGDLQRFMDFHYLAQVTRVNVAVLASLATGPGRPTNTVVDVHDLSNDTVLRWSAVPGAVRYQVVRRPTTAPTWTDVTDTGNATTITLPISKDDFIFGVRAVDAAGRAGVPAYPQPQR